MGAAKPFAFQMPIFVIDTRRKQRVSPLIFTTKRMTSRDELKYQYGLAVLLDQRITIAIGERARSAIRCLALKAPQLTFYYEGG